MRGYLYAYLQYFQDINFVFYTDIQKSCPALNWYFILEILSSLLMLMSIRYYRQLEIRCSLPRLVGIRYYPQMVSW